MFIFFQVLSSDLLLIFECHHFFNYLIIFFFIFQWTDGGRQKETTPDFRYGQVNKVHSNFILDFYLFKFTWSEMLYRLRTDSSFAPSQ